MAGRLPAEPEAVAIPGLCPHAGVKALDDSPCSVRKEFVDQKRLAEIGIPAAHSPAASRRESSTAQCQQLGLLGGELLVREHALSCSSPSSFICWIGPGAGVGRRRRRRGRRGARRAAVGLVGRSVRGGLLRLAMLTGRVRCPAEGSGRPVAPALTSVLLVPLVLLLARTSRASQCTERTTSPRRDESGWLAALRGRTRRRLVRTPPPRGEQGSRARSGRRRPRRRRERAVEGVAVAQVARDRDGVSGTGVRPASSGHRPRVKVIVRRVHHSTSAEPFASQSWRT